MDDQVLMGVVDGVADFAKEAEAIFDAEAVMIAVFVDGHALDEFHDEVGRAVVGGSAVEESRDVGVLELGEGLAFGAEAPPRGFVGEAASDDLDGDALLVLIVGAHGPKDGTHAADGHDAFDAVFPDAPTDAGIGIQAGLGAVPLAGYGRVEEVAGPAIGGEERQHLAFEWIVAATGSLDEGVSRVGRLGEGLHEQVADAVSGITLHVGRLSRTRHRSRRRVDS
jgi:hypothetical protein